MSRYVRGHFAVADPHGRPVVLRWAGASRDGDVVLLQLTGARDRGLGPARG